MKKIFTFLASIVIPTSAIMAGSGFLTAKTHEFVKTESTSITNHFTFDRASDYYLYFHVYMSNSSTNGFTNFWEECGKYHTKSFTGLVFMQNLFQFWDDNDFNYAQSLPSGCSHSFIAWADRFETGMGHFGAWDHSKSTTAEDMCESYDWSTLANYLMQAYNEKKATYSGVEFYFEFEYHASTSYVMDRYTYSFE